MSINNYSKVVFYADSTNLSFARVCAFSFAAGLDLTIEKLDDIKLSVSEAVSNCIIHAYIDRTSLIHMTFESYQDDAQKILTITIEDNGVGISDIEAAKNAGYSSDPERLGMGFTLMESLSDEFCVFSTQGEGTKVVLRFIVTAEMNVIEGD